MNKVWVYCDKIEKSKIIKKMIRLSINFYDEKDIDGHFLFLINESDINRLNKYSVYKFSVYKYEGLKKYVSVLRNTRTKIIMGFIAILLIIFLSNVIVSVNIIHSKKEIRFLILNELEKEGIKRLSIKKDFKSLEKIKKKILSNNKDKLEWLEIESKGMSYVVRVEERIIPPKKEEKKYCNVLATKEGIVRRIFLKNGVSLIKIGSYVKKGDIIFTGDIILNEDTVSCVCAEGNVYAEVWYKINVEEPLLITQKVNTKRRRNNIMIAKNGNEYKIFKKRLDKSTDINHYLFNLFNYDVYFQKEAEYKVLKKRLSEKEATDIAIKKAMKSLENRLDDETKILSQKVLKKRINDSKIYVELFVTVEEKISQQQIIE